MPPFGYKHTPEARAKMSLGQRRRTVYTPPTPEHRARISAFHRGNKYAAGRVVSAETRAKIAAALLGKPMSAEARAAMSAAGKRRAPPSAETRAKLSATSRGRKKTPEQRALQSARQRGPNAPNWKGGISSANELVRKSAAYREWRVAVFTRDDYTCQMCGDRGGVLHADHIQRFAEHPELRLVLSNGRTLCAPCHRLTKTYGATRL